MPVIKAEPDELVTQFVYIFQDSCLGCQGTRFFFFFLTALLWYKVIHSTLLEGVRITSNT